jgi:signal transduction histidine kinase
LRARTASRLAWSLWALNLALLVAGSVMSIIGRDRPGQLVLWILIPALQLISGTVGALIASRHPGNAIGWLFLWMALGWGISGLGTAVAALAAGGVIAVSPAVRVADWFGAWALTPGIIIPVAFLFLLFPDGHLLSRRWRWVGIAAIVGVCVAAAEVALSPGPIEDAVILGENPYAVGSEEVWGAAGGLGWIVAILSVVASAGAMFRRFRRASGEDRQRIAWLAYGSIVVAVLFLTAAIGFFTFGAEGADPVMATVVLPSIIVLALLVIPTVTGIAMLRHRLFDIEMVVSRTVVYGVLAAFVTLVYVGIVVGVGALVGSRGNLLLSILATAVIALAFQPIRDRARRMANRLVYGKRSSPYEAMSEFAERVAGMYSLEEVLPRMARIAAEGTGAELVEVWVLVGGRFHREASWPERDGSAHAAVARSAISGDRVVEVSHRGEDLGAIAVTMPRNEPLSPAGERLLSDLASQAGLVLRNVRLIEELRASRQRLVAAQDEERRRLERNIHDGAQQQLVALSVKLRLAENLARKDADKAAELMAQVRAETQQALEDLRDLARGIYPPLLADQGLAAAVDSQARKAVIPVAVEPDGVGRYPQEAEAAAYFCVLEALQNVSKYAGASAAVVRLSEDNGDLVFSVSDDGRGFDPATTPRGSGLQNMADRLDALGGRFEIVSRPNEGTTVTGRIPIHRVAAAQASSSRSGSNSDLGM